MSLSLPLAAGSLLWELVLNRRADGDFADLDVVRLLDREGDGPRDRVRIEAQRVMGGLAAGRTPQRPWSDGASRRAGNKGAPLKVERIRLNFGGLNA